MVDEQRRYIKPDLQMQVTRVGSMRLIVVLHSKRGDIRPVDIGWIKQFVRGKGWIYKKDVVTDVGVWEGEFERNHSF